MPESLATSSTPLNGRRLSISGSNSSTPRRKAILPTRLEPKQHDSMESFGRVSVAEPLIQREQGSPSTTRGVGHERIGLPLQSFVRNRFHEVPEAAEIVSQFGG
jgi:hypothetical protein